jgi:hypothetical protein
MTWLVWRQHRKQLLFAAAALVVLAAFFIYTGRPMHDRFERAGLPDCLPAAQQAPVVVDLGAAPGVPAGVGDAPPQDTPEPDDATLAVGRCVQDAARSSTTTRTSAGWAAPPGPADARRHVLGSTAGRP